jgi:O-antigen/teichoic acid export membrane protein
MARNRTSFHKILENVVWMTGAEIVGRGISFVTMVHLSRTLEPAGMGVVDFGLSVFVMVQIFTLGGVEVLGTRLAARSERRLRALAGTVCLIGWIFFALAYACVVGLLPLLAGKSEMRTAALLFALATFLAPLGLRFAYLGRERLAIPAIASVLVHAGILGLVLMLVRERDDLRIVPFIWIGCESLRALLQYIAFRRRYGGIRLRLRWLHLRAWLAAALPLTVSRVGRGFLLVLDLLMLGFLASPAEVGFYGVGLRIPQRDLRSAVPRGEGARRRAVPGDESRRRSRGSLHRRPDRLRNGAERRDPDRDAVR